MQNIDTIRDILVGDQIHAVNERFATLEKSLEAHYAKLVNQLMSKFEAVQSLSKAEVDELRREVNEATEKLRQEDGRLTDELRRTGERIDNLDKKQDEMRAQITEQVRKMYEEFSKQMTDFSRLVKAQHDEMNQRMVSRNDLATLLNGLASGISANNVQESKQSSGA